MNKAAVSLLVLSIGQPAIANTSPSAPLEPMIVSAVATPAPQLVLPANTEVALRVNDTITTKGKSFNEGDTFGLTVAQNVFLDGYVVIPQGARATGRITWMTSKGAFGKSGKMEIAIEYVEVGGRRIPLEGTYRQEGEGNTVATVGGVVAVGVLAGFVTGRSAVIPQGRELTARTKQDLPIRLAARQEPQPSNIFSAPPARSSATAVTPSRQAPSRPAGRSDWGLVAVDAP